MAASDDARRWTQSQLESLERQIGREYEQAAREMRGKQAKALERFAREREARERALDATEAAREAHERWLRGQIAQQQNRGALIDQLAQAAHDANVRAADMVNDRIPRVAAGNANRAAYEIDGIIGRDTRFALVDEDTVRHLMAIRTEGADPQQLIRETVWFQAQEGREGMQEVRKRLAEIHGRRVDYARDIRWNRQKFTSAITQGILQGESIPDIVKRTESVFGQNRSAAYRAARTACTSAENAGRLGSYERAARLGIPVVKEWIAAHDGRTRDSHRALDGQQADPDEPFETRFGHLMYPGDPSGATADVANCRCTLRARVKGYEDRQGERWARLPEDMTYDEWVDAKAVSRAESYENPWTIQAPGWMPQNTAGAAVETQVGSFAGVVDGSDILATWQRRSDEFDFEIEDVMNAQGFDGKPRIVDADEFDRAVKAANNGDGLVMQRSYSAPDQATLDAYRDMLYDGKWYVDCSTGGSQYGQGMYAAADYTGKVTADMQREMRHYTTLNQGRLGAQPLSDEGKEAFLRKWVGENVAEADRDAAFTYLKFESHTGNVAWADVGKAVEHLGEEKRLSLLESGVHEDVHQMLDGHSYVETMTLDPSAKVISFDDITREKSAFFAEQRRSATEFADIKSWGLTDAQQAIAEDYLYGMIGGTQLSPATMAKAFEELPQSAIDRIFSISATSQYTGVAIPVDMDIGAFAAARGYDAINAVGHGASGSYTVVLNRTKLIIRRPE